jgi:hypothetical protein
MVESRVLQGMGMPLDSSSAGSFCVGMSANLTITLKAEVAEELLSEAAAAGQTAEEYVAEMVRQRCARRESGAEMLRRIQARVAPYARAAGYENEDQILRDLS